MELETSEAKNTAPCQEMRQPAGRVLGGTKTFPGTGTLRVSPTARHRCPSPGSPRHAVAGVSAHSGRRQQGPWLCHRSCAVGVLTCWVGMQMMEEFGDALCSVK